MKYTFTTNNEYEAQLLLNADRLRSIIWNMREMLIAHFNNDHTVTLEEIFEALNNQIECQEIEGVLNPIIG